MQKAIAVDFDGTICENNWPYIGPAKWRVIRKLKREQAKGARLILWTCREGEMLRDALDWCLFVGLFFDAVNENLPERVKHFGNDCRKISADEYWDDKAIKIR